jgi:hypothetical protein
VRTPLGYPRKDDEQRLSRAQAALLGLYLSGTSKAERALVLARHLAAERLLDVDKLRSVFLQLGFSSDRQPDAELTPIGIWCAGDPARAARFAREACTLAEADPRAVEAAAAYCAAIAAGVGGAPLEEMQKDPPCVSALQGAARGREAFSAEALLEVLATRPDRPFELWPDDVLELAEALVQ